MVMRIQYQLRPLTVEEKLFCRYVLLDEMDRQVWFGILISSVLNQEEIICLQ
jgi:hypothetical protein